LRRKILWSGAAARNQHHRCVKTRLKSGPTPSAQKPGGFRKSVRRHLRFRVTENPPPMRVECPYALVRIEPVHSSSPRRSFTASFRFCRDPRYRSVVWMEAAQQELNLLEVPPDSRQNFAQVRLISWGASLSTSPVCPAYFEHDMPDHALAQSHRRLFRIFSATHPAKQWAVR
jgi:hypothetical protein